MKILNLILLCCIYLNCLAQPGQFDFTFNYFNPLNSTDGSIVDINYIFTQPDRKMILTGYFMNPTNLEEFSLIRIDEDGNADPTFQLIPYTYFIEPDVIHNVLFFSNGKMLVSGGFTSFFGNNNYPRLGCLNANGSVDNTFSVQDTLFQQSVATEFVTEIQSDDKFLIYYSDYQELRRYNSNGTIDNTFNLNGLAINALKSLKFLPNGKILLLGDLTGGNGSQSFQCLNTDGSVDLNFPMNEVSCSFEVKIKPHNNLIYIFSSQLFVNSTDVHNVAVFNLNGVLDNNFFTNVSNNTANGPIYTGDIQPNGSIILGGNFSEFNGIPNNTLVRLNPDGSYDGSFNSFDGAQNGTVLIENIVCLSNFKSIISGAFMDYNNYPANGLQRIGNINSNLQLYTLPDNGQCDGKLYANQQLTQPVNYVIDNIDTLLMVSTPYANFNNLCSGIYNFKTTDPNTNSLIAVQPFLIPTPSNFYPVQVDTNFISFGDTLTFGIENCLIDYSSIDSVYLASYNFYGQDTIELIFHIVDANQVTTIPLYVSINYFGNFLFQLQLYCLQKNLGSNAVIDMALFNDGNHITMLEIQDKADLNNIGLYPNPTSDQVTITMTTNSANLRVYDIQGKMVAEQKVVSGSEVSLKEFETGVYLFEVISEGNRTVKRIVKN